MHFEQISLEMAKKLVSRKAPNERAKPAREPRKR